MRQWKSANGQLEANGQRFNLKGKKEPGLDCHSDVGANKHLAILT